MVGTFLGGTATLTSLLQLRRGGTSAVVARRRTPRLYGARNALPHGGMVSLSLRDRGFQGRPGGLEGMSRAEYLTANRANQQAPYHIHINENPTKIRGTAFSNRQLVAKKS